MVPMDLQNDPKMVTKMMPLAPLGDQVDPKSRILEAWNTDPKKT